MLTALFRAEIEQDPYPKSGSRSYRMCNLSRHECGCEHHHNSHRLNFILNWFERNIVMAKLKAAAQPSWTPTTFVKCDLDADTKKRVPEFIKKSSADIDDLVTQVLQDNHKISFSYNGQSDSYICSVTGKPEECNNASKCYTSHAKDYGTALWVALYKYHVIWQRGPWEEIEADSDFG